MKADGRRLAKGIGGRVKGQIEADFRRIRNQKAIDPKTRQFEPLMDVNPNTEFYRRITQRKTIGRR
jgi:hypothetical protein